tara:strand:+ start:137 stop:1030 length:894 start_codon:yes stop_codon:yes gene_type:complete
VSSKLFPLLALAGAGFAFSKAFGAKKTVNREMNPFRTDPFRPDTAWRRNLNFSSEPYDVSKLMNSNLTDFTPEGKIRLTEEYQKIISSIDDHPCPPGYTACGHALGDLLIYHPTLKMTLVPDFKICSVNSNKYFNARNQPAEPFANRKTDIEINQDFVDESLNEKSRSHETMVLLIPRIRPSWHYADFWKGKSAFASSTDPIWTVLTQHFSAVFQPADTEDDAFVNVYPCPGYIDEGDISTLEGRKIAAGYYEFGRPQGGITRTDRFLGKKVLIAQEIISNLVRERMLEAGVKVEKA